MRIFSEVELLLKWNMGAINNCPCPDDDPPDPPPPPPIPPDPPPGGGRY